MANRIELYTFKHNARFLYIRLSKSKNLNDKLWIRFRYEDKEIKLVNMHVQEYNIGSHEKGAKVTVDLREPTGKTIQLYIKFLSPSYKVKKTMVRRLIKDSPFA